MVKGHVHLKNLTLPVSARFWVQFLVKKKQKKTHIVCGVYKYFMSILVIIITHEIFPGQFLKAVTNFLIF